MIFLYIVISQNPNINLEIIKRSPLYPPIMMQETGYFHITADSWTAGNYRPYKLNVLIFIGCALARAN